MNVIYLDKLSFFSLVAVLGARMDYAGVYYFNTSSCGERIARLFSALRLVKSRPQFAQFHLANIRDEKGEAQSVKISEDIRDICLELSDKELAHNSFLQGFGQHFDFRKILLFFEKVVAEEINESVVLVNAAHWHAINEVGVSDGDVVFFLEKNLWSRYLVDYASRLDIKATEYRTFISFPRFRYLGKIKEAVSSSTRSKLNSLGKSKKSRPDKKRELLSSQVSRKKPPLISGWYTGKTVTFDLNKRSDLFWMLNSIIPRERVLIYFDRPEPPATQEAVDVLGKQGVKSIALTSKAAGSEHISLWQAGRKYRDMMRFYVKLLAKKVFLSAVKLNVPSLFYVANMYYFIKHYCFWYDFFDEHNVKINVSPYDFTRPYMAKNLALERCGGVSVSYQWSNLNFSSISIANCSDVMFSFGPAYRWVLEKNRSLISNLIYCGYITDYSFKEVKEGAAELRRELLARGVRFIICYFDENSSDDRMFAISNDRSALIYKLFIEKMLEDSSLGLIFKPGYPKTLYQRISSISSLIEKAKATGRCIFLDEGSYVTEKYPTEAAQAADISVGLLLSGTASLESYLSGTPTVFLDLEKLYSNPVYQWGKGKVVFDNPDDLFVAIDTFRQDPDAIPGFGDLSSWVKDRDPFKDGSASLRMEQYINWLYEKLSQGKTREETIEYANRKYAERWGKENVIRIGFEGPMGQGVKEPSEIQKTLESLNPRILEP